MLAASGQIRRAACGRGPRRRTSSTRTEQFERRCAAQGQMNFDHLQAEIRRFGEAAYALSALGAALRVRGGAPVHAQVEPYLREAVERILGGPLVDAEAGQVASALAIVTLQIEQSNELFEHPERAPAWFIEDPGMLQAQSNASAITVEHLLQLPSDRPCRRRSLAGC